jgi:UDP-N-acetylglucosamine--N-acetylmuramyl-(pentapeptide) pyrophosphoryl-undecaprenol N-acetylglucosamine transferase
MTRLLIASAGGHLTQLALIAPRLWPPADEELWVTFDSEQSRALLAGRRVQFIRDTKPRDWRSVLVNTRVARSMLSDDIDTVVSTGCGVALSFLPLANARGISTHYIESAARVESPSVTGRILEHLPGIHLYTQHREDANSRWQFVGSVFDSFHPVSVPDPPPLRRVVVTVGTLDFSFIGLLERLRAILTETVDVVVQAGIDSVRLDWPGATVRSMMTADEVRSAMVRADVVVAHAGIGSALVALGVGKVPILVPRKRSRNEHVDDHQAQIARHLEAHGLAVMADSATVNLEHFSEALTRGVEQTAAARRFLLQ